MTSLDEINEEGILVNLAFANSSDYNFIQGATNALMEDIQAYEEGSASLFSFMLAPLVSERGLKFGEVSKRDGYFVQITSRKFNFEKA